MDDAEKRELANSYVNLKDHFDDLWRERSSNISLQFRGVSDSLAETAKVLEHRLEVLNHAHEQSVQDRLEFANKDEQERLQVAFDKFKLEIVQQKLEGNVFYDFKKDWEIWKREEYGKWKEKVDREQTTSNTRTVTIASVMGVIFIIIQIVIAFWRK